MPRVRQKRPWFTRLHANLFDNIETTCLTTGQDGTTFLPRLGSTRLLRVITLRTRMADDRLVLTHMTPEQAYDLGERLMKTARAQGRTNIQRNGEGFIVNTATPDSGWTTATITGNDRTDLGDKRHES